MQVVFERSCVLVILLALILIVLLPGGDINVCEALNLKDCSVG
jgi:hypothetical protein